MVTGYFKFYNRRINLQKKKFKNKLLVFLIIILSERASKTC